MNHIMYVVKNEAGEYLTTWPDEYGYAEWHPVLTEFAINSAATAKRLQEDHGGQIYQVQLIISDTPVQEN